MTPYTEAKSRRDTRGMNAAYLKARASIHIQLAKEVRYGRVKLKRIREAVSV